MIESVTRTPEEVLQSVKHLLLDKIKTTDITTVDGDSAKYLALIEKAVQINLTNKDYNDEMLYQDLISLGQKIETSATKTTIKSLSQTAFVSDLLSLIKPNATVTDLTPASSTEMTQILDAFLSQITADGGISDSVKDKLLNDLNNYMKSSDGKSLIDADKTLYTKLNSFLLKYLDTSNAIKTVTAEDFVSAADTFVKGLAGIFGANNFNYDLNFAIQNYLNKFKTGSDIETSKDVYESSIINVLTALAGAYSTDKVSKTLESDIINYLTKFLFSGGITDASSDEYIKSVTDNVNAIHGKLNDPMGIMDNNVEALTALNKTMIDGMNVSAPVPNPQLDIDPTYVDNVGVTLGIMNAGAPAQVAGVDFQKSKAFDDKLKTNIESINAKGVLSSNISTNYVDNAADLNNTTQNIIKDKVNENYTPAFKWLGNFLSFGETGLGNLSTTVKGTGGKIGVPLVNALNTDISAVMLGLQELLVAMSALAVGGIYNAITGATNQRQFKFKNLQDYSYPTQIDGASVKYDFEIGDGKLDAYNGEGYGTGTLNEYLSIVRDGNDSLVTNDPDKIDFKAGNLDAKLATKLGLTADTKTKGGNVLESVYENDMNDLYDSTTGKYLNVYNFSNMIQKYDFQLLNRWKVVFPSNHPFISDDFKNLLKYYATDFSFSHPEMQMASFNYGMLYNDIISMKFRPMTISFMIDSRMIIPMAFNRLIHSAMGYVHRGILGWKSDYLLPTIYIFYENKNNYNKVMGIKLHNCIIIDGGDYGGAQDNQEIQTYKLLIAYEEVSFAGFYTYQRHDGLGGNDKKSEILFNGVADYKSGITKGDGVYASMNKNTKESVYDVDDTSDFTAAFNE